MNCTFCGRFMNNQGTMDDPENLEPYEYTIWYCNSCDISQYEVTHYKGSTEIDPEFWEI